MFLQMRGINKRACTCAGLFRKQTLKQVLTQVVCVGGDPRKSIDLPTPNCHLLMGFLEDRDSLPLPGTNQAQTRGQEEDVLRIVANAVNVCGDGNTEGLWMGSPMVLLHPSFYQFRFSSISVSKQEIHFYILKKVIPDHDAWWEPYYVTPSARVSKPTWILKGTVDMCYIGLLASFLPSCITLMEGSVGHRNLTVFWLQK